MENESGSCLVCRLGSECVAGWIGTVQYCGFCWSGEVDGCEWDICFNVGWFVFG